MSVVWPGRRFVGRGHPQGAIAAPFGAFYLDEVTGAVYQKMAGQGPTGWYLAIAPIMLGWHAYWASQNTAAVAIFGQYGMQNVPVFAFGTGISRAYLQPAGRHFAGGYTTAVSGNAALIRSGGLPQGGPFLMEGGDYPAEMDVDAAWDILTTPRVTSIATDTDMLAIRIWCGMLGQGATLTTDATLVSSDTLNTAFGPSLATGAGQWGAMFRFSTAAADPGWVFVSCNDNGAAFSQTVTNLNVTALRDTVYRLRCRYLRSRTPKAFAVSINDGPETIITANVGVGAGSASNNRFYAPYCGVQTLDAALSALAVSKYIATWGSPTQ